MSKADIFLISKDQCWATNQEYFNNINVKYKFTLDPCADKINAKCSKFFTEEQNGLIQSWKNERVFLNPPFNEVDKWIEKAYYENKVNNVFIFILIKSRTETKTFHKYMWDKDNAKPRDGVSVNFIEKRMVYGTDDYWNWYWEQEFIDGKVNKKYKKYGQKGPATFASMEIIFFNKEI